MSSYSIVSRDFDYLEIPWLKYCFSNLPFFFAHIDDYSAQSQSSIPIFLVSQNSRQSLDDYFSLTESLVRERRVFGLIHISDEWYLRANYSDLYHGASFIFRNYFSPILRGKKVFQLPLGADIFFLRTFMTNPKKCCERSVPLHFSGQLKYSRIPMIRAMSGLTGNHSFPSFQSYVEYVQHMANTRFALCPNGNTTPDTYRLYEALMLGCVPIVERGLWGDYLTSLFGESCPIQSFSSWRQARKFIEKTSLGELQLYSDAVNQWWNEYLRMIPIECRDFVLRTSPPTEPAPAISRPRNQSLDFIRHILWLISLQNGYVLRARVRKIFRNAL
jgi:hypothetical protein